MDLVGCVLSVVAITLLRLPDLDAKEALRLEESHHMDGSPQASGPSLQALTFAGGARFIAWHPFLGEYQQGLRHFGGCRACLGYNPLFKPILKKALCWSRLFGGAHNNITGIPVIVSMKWVGMWSNDKKLLYI